MVAQPFTPELTPVEISERWQRLYHPPVGRDESWRDCLLEVQEAIVDLIETTPELAKYFRILRPRKEKGQNSIKTFTSIIEKINTYRRNGDTSYDIDSLNDLIGAQMLCPYLDDINEVLNWLYDRQRGGQFFQLDTTRKTAEKEKREREEKTGYRAYHICLRLKENVVRCRNLPPGSEMYKFELQIKTLLEAAWDGKTHDVTYKAKGIEGSLLEHMKFISHSLTAIDEQTKLLRYAIEEEKNAQSELRNAALLQLFYVSLTEDGKKQLQIENTRIEDWQQEDADKLEDRLQKYEKGIDKIFCIGLALLALYKGDRYMQEKALSYCTALVKQAEIGTTLHKALRVRTFLRWAFRYTPHALRDIDYCLEHFDDSSTIRDKNDFVYYICDVREPDDTDLNKARRFLKELKNNLKSGMEMPWAHIDTIARFYIRFAETEADVNKGLKYGQQAKESAKTEEEKRVSNAYQRYNEYLAIRQIARLRRGMGKGFLSL